jgi:hypothetical protein
LYIPYHSTGYKTILRWWVDHDAGFCPFLKLIVRIKAKNEGQRSEGVNATAMPLRLPLQRSRQRIQGERAQQVSPHTALYFGQAVGGVRYPSEVGSLG